MKDKITLDKAFEELMKNIEHSINVRFAILLEKVYTKIEVKKRYEALELLKDLYLAPKEAAQALQCCNRSLQYYTQQGKLKSIKRGGKVWYKLEDIIDFLEQRDKDLPSIV